MSESVSETICVREASVPRPHYLVTIKAVTQGHPDLLPGLLQDEVTMTVCLPTNVGTDLEAIKRAAARRFAALATKLVDQPIEEKQEKAEVPRTKVRADEEQRHAALVSEAE